MDGALPHSARSRFLAAAGTAVTAASVGVAAANPAGWAVGLAFAATSVIYALRTTRVRAKRRTVIEEPDGTVVRVEESLEWRGPGGPPPGFPGFA